MFVIVNRHKPTEHGGQDHCHECGGVIDYRLTLLTVQTQTRPTRSYHVPCWDYLVEVVQAVIDNPPPTPDDQTGTGGEG